MRCGQKSLTGAKFNTFIGRFENGGAASMAVKGLIIQSNNYCWTRPCNWCGFLIAVALVLIASPRTIANTRKFNKNVLLVV